MNNAAHIYGMYDLLAGVIKYKISFTYMYLNIPVQRTSYMCTCAMSFHVWLVLQQ